jgi:hypothetical protein
MMQRQREESDRQREETINARRILGKTRVTISKIANRIKVFKFCLLNVRKREYGI